MYMSLIFGRTVEIDAFCDLGKTKFTHDQSNSLKKVQEVSSYFSPTTTTESKPGSCKFLSNSALKKYKLNFKDRVAQIILLVDCCLQSYFLRTAKYLALRTTKMATAADTTSWTSTNKHWIAFSQFLRSETKHIIRGYMDIGLSGQLINVTLNPYNYHYNRVYR